MKRVLSMKEDYTSTDFTLHSTDVIEYVRHQVALTIEEEAIAF